MEWLGRVRAVVTDLDGTIIHGDTISPATLRAAARLRRLGVPFLAATARTPAGVMAVDTLVPHLTMAVTCGGAIGWEPSGRGILWREEITGPDVGEILAAAAARLPGAGIAGYTGQRWLMTAGYARLRGWIHFGPTQQVPVTALAGEPLCAMAICHPTLDAAEMVGILAPVVGDRLHLTWSEPRAVDITPAEADKGTGVTRALGLLGVDPADALAFGDMPNDLPMFRVCGYAVAVANAHPSVLAAATMVTGGVTEDGVADLLARLGAV